MHRTPADRGRSGPARSLVAADPRDGDGRSGPRRRSRPGPASPARPPRTPSRFRRPPGPGQRAVPGIGDHADRRDQPLRHRLDGRRPPRTSEHGGDRREGVGAVVIAKSEQGQPLRQVVGRQPFAYVEHAATLGHCLPGCRRRRPANTGPDERPSPSCRTARPPSPTPSRRSSSRAGRPTRPSSRPAARPPRPAATGGPRSAPMFPGERLVIPRRRAQGPLQRHRLPVPAALGVRPPDRSGHRPRAGRRAGAGADRRRPRRHPVLHAARTARLRGVLRRRPLRRDVGRAPAVAGGAGRALRHPLRRHRRARRPAAQERRGDRDPGPARGRPGPGRADRRDPRGAGRAGRARPHEPGRRAGRGPERAAADQGRLRDRRRCGEACRQTAEAFARRGRRPSRGGRRGRGERWVEGIFGLHARHVGNAVGYDTIAASGDHACTLHWIRNDGDLREGDLLLLDAGVELDTLYTADVTRTLPVNGRFSDDQRMVYEAVLEAQQAGIAAAQPGAKFSDVHEAAIAVIARKLEEWGLLPVTRGGVAVRGRRPAPTLDGARHLAPPRHRRARLRAGPAGEVPRGNPRSRA